MPSLNRNSPEPFYQQVYEQIASSIESGLYSAGKRLPSIRECARELGVSNSTIELAYQQLVAEGYISARRGSGHVVNMHKATPGFSPARSEEYRAALAQLEADNRDTSPEPRYDFAYDSIDAETFPFVSWARICREVYFSAGSERACLYDDPQGLFELRAEIARYINTEQGLDWTPEQVLVMPTTRVLMTTILSLVDLEGCSVGMEEPGYDEVATALRSVGISVKPVPLYPHPDPETIEDHLDNVKLLFTTPVSQFPTNTPMSLTMRKKLVDWANRTGAYLIDDEYGWELQSSVARMPSPAALDRAGNVIVTGTFSNTFSPAVCLSYALLPPQLMLKWRAACGSRHPQVPWQTQAAMARFMQDGLWRAHRRKLRTTHQKKHAALMDAIQASMGSAVEVVDSPSSQFVLVKTIDGRSEDELIEAAMRAGIAVYPTARYWQGAMPANWTYVQVGYASIPLDDIPAGIRELARAWNIIR